MARTHFIDQICTHNGGGNRRDDNKLALTRYGTTRSVQKNQSPFLYYGGHGVGFFTPENR